MFWEDSAEFRDYWYTCDAAKQYSIIKEAGGWTLYDSEELGHWEELDDAKEGASHYCWL